MCRARNANWHKRGHLGGIRQPEPILAVLLEEDRRLDRGIPQEDLDVDLTRTLDAAAHVLSGRVGGVVPEGEVGPELLVLVVPVEGRDGLVADLAGGEPDEGPHGGVARVALDDEDAVVLVGLGPADGAGLGVGGDAAEDGHLLNLGLVAVGLDVQGRGGGFAQGGCVGIDVVHLRGPDLG